MQRNFISSQQKSGNQVANPEQQMGLCFIFIIIVIIIAISWPTN